MIPTDRKIYGVDAMNALLNVEVERDASPIWFYPNQGDTYFKDERGGAMMNRLILCFSVLMLLCGCNQKRPKEEPAILSTSKHVDQPQPSPAIDKIKEAPAVIYRSVDLGTTWSAFNKGIPEDATLSGIDQDGNKIYVATDFHGVFVSSDGQDDWKELNNTVLNNLDINCIEVEGEAMVVGTRNQGILFSKDGGIQWRPGEQKIKSPIRALVRFNGTLYGGTDMGIFESKDGGESWSHVFGQMQILGFTLLNEKIYVATQSGVLMSDGSNASWRSIYDGDALHDIGNDGKCVYAMTISRRLLKTQDDGLSWEDAQNGIPRPPNFYTNELQHIGNTVFSAQWIGIYQSIDHGAHWRKLGGLPDSTAFSTLAITDYGIVAGISIR